VVYLEPGDEIGRCADELSVGLVGIFVIAGQYVIPVPAVHALAVGHQDGVDLRVSQQLFDGLRASRGGSVQFGHL